MLFTNICYAGVWPNCSPVVPVAVCTEVVGRSARGVLVCMVACIQMTVKMLWAVFGHAEPSIAVGKAGSCLTVYRRMSCLCVEQTCQRVTPSYQSIPR
jgi:hypothetical protein